MRLLLVLLFCGSCFGQAAKKSCLIVNQHRHSFGENAMRWTPAKPYNWVEGEFPKSVKFNHELGNKQIQQVQNAGGKVVVMKQDFSQLDLEDARKQCSLFQAEAK